MNLMLMLLLMISSSIFSSEYEVIRLASFPRSGNHWMRYMLEDYTGIATASEYCDIDPPHLPQPFDYGYVCEHGYLENCRYAEIGETVFMKTHYPYFPHNAFHSHTKTIRIVRNPVDSFISLKFYSINVDQGISDATLYNYINEWKSWQHFWNRQEDVLTIRYEDLIENQKATFCAILEFSGIEIDDEKIDSTLSKFSPSDSELKHIHHYNSQQLDRIEKELNELLIQFNYKVHK